MDDSRRGDCRHRLRKCEEDCVLMVRKRMRTFPSPLRGRLVEEQVKELARAAGGSLTLNVGLASYG